MLFNSLNFVVFLPVVFIAYWFFTKGNLKIQNRILLAASYVFYSFWDWRFLFLLIFSTFLDYFSGIKMAEAPQNRVRQFWFWSSIAVNLGFLGVFKYYNFFAESFSTALLGLGLKVNPWTLKIILPVGISFYTFHGLSYVIDVYKNRIKAERDFIDYAVFVSFFPLLVAGPIERATHLLPQIKNSRTFDYTKAVDGLRQILWGLFKKVVIADNCALYANEIFNHSGDYGGFTLLLGALFFAMQIYGDFSGYSDIALGTARLFGIELLRNFSYPYFSRDIAEFWRRWHISLSTWFRDYVYIPLGGSKKGKWIGVRNTFIIFIVSGFWHGANWTFIVWGLLNAIYFLPLLLTGKTRTHFDIVAKDGLLPSFSDAVKISVTFFLTLVAWVFFRAETVGHAFQYLVDMVGGLFSYTQYITSYSFLRTRVGLALPILLILFLFVEWIGREHSFSLARLGAVKSRAIRWGVYSILVFGIGMYMQTKESPFIYFQF